MKGIGREIAYYVTSDDITKEDTYIKSILQKPKKIKKKKRY